MRQEVSELKKMVHNLMAEKGNVSLVTPVPPASVPTIIHPVKAPCPVDDDIQDTEEYVEESLSLDEVKKEMIRKLWKSITEIEKVQHRIWIFPSVPFIEK